MNNTELTQPNIRIEDMLSDGFVIVVERDGVCARHRFDPEDAHIGLIEVFQSLGFVNVSYEEVY